MKGGPSSDGISRRPCGPASDIIVKVMAGRDALAGQRGWHGPALNVPSNKPPDLKHAALFAHALIVSHRAIC